MRIKSNVKINTLLFCYIMFTLAFSIFCQINQWIFCDLCDRIDVAKMTGWCIKMIANDILTACETLTIEVKHNVLSFINFLVVNDMIFEKCGGYWENQNYYFVKYKNEYVCFILINGSGTEEKFAPFTVWSDDSGSKWYENVDLDDKVKSIAWENVDICEYCGSCSGGKSKLIFGKEFENVCRTTFRFVNPNENEFECLKKLIQLRKNDINEQK